MAKVILTNKNSVWGVIVKPQSSNVYRHVMSFDTPELKDQFIKDEVMNGQDYKVEIQKKSSVSLIYNDAGSASYQADPKDYPGESVYDLLNKDFAIVLVNDYEPDPSKHRYLFYALNPKRNGSTVVYGMELDIFFTYDVKDMFNDKEANITRAMADRFYREEVINEDGTKTYKNTPIYFDSRVNANPRLTSPLYNAEEVDQSISDDILWPTEETSPVMVDHSDLCRGDWDDGNQIIPATDVSLVNKIMASLNWSYIASTEKQGKYSWIKQILMGPYNNTAAISTSGEISPITGVDSYSKQNLYGYTLGCASGTKVDGHSYRLYIQVVTPDDSGYTYPASYLGETIVGAAEAIQGSYTKLPFSPFTKYINKLHGSDDNTNPLDEVEIRFGRPDKLSDDGTHWVGITGEIKDGYFTEPDGYRPIIISFGTSYSEKAKHGYGPFGVVTAVKPAEKPEDEEEFGFLTIIDPITYHGTEKTLIGMEINEDKDYVLNESNDRDDDNEIKMNLSPYKKIKLHSSTSNSMWLIPQLFDSSEREVKYNVGHGYMIEASSWWANIKNYKNYFMTSNQTNPGYLPTEISSSYFEDVANYSQPTLVSAWNEYISRNKAQLNTNLLNSGVSAVAGVAGIAGSMFTGGATMPLAIAGLSIAVKSAMDISKQAASIKDIQNSPNKITHNSSTLNLAQSSKSITPQFREYRVDPKISKLLSQHFYKYGYAYKDELKKISDVIGTRYHFNYIEASDSFENVKINVSSPIKQIINDSIEAGLTIWNYRDPKTFYGVKNYEHENIEMSIYNSIKAGK